MTSQKKNYIEPRDILAVRIDCNDCGASLTLRLAQKMNFAAASQCPNCGRSWARMMQTSIENELEKCATAIWHANACIERQLELSRNTGSKGFTVSLEISEPSDPASSGKG